MAAITGLHIASKLAPTINKLVFRQLLKLPLWRQFPQPIHRRTNRHNDVVNFLDRGEAAQAEADCAARLEFIAAHRPQHVRGFMTR